MLDFFSVYACLRSFSTLLFLSPFELEDFVAALKCKSPSPLFDFIHVSILQTLRKHLEFLSDEGSQSASDCLRCLNWGLLDLITWPIFMVEYLLIHGSGLKPDFNFSRLKLFESEYYRQPVSVKVEILRCLCDDVIEVEAIRSELNRRSLAAVPDRDFDRNVNMEMCKKRRTVMDVSGGSCLTEEVVEETTDWNSDECCLCKMDGSLICCDGCPAAYHSRCVGVATDLLPEGEWYCPECVIEKHNPWMKPRKSLRGAQLLGIDPDDRLYFSSCGYLLVSDSCDTEYSINYYHRNDLNAVIDALKASDIRYGGILNAISKNWDIPINFSGANSNLDSQNHAVCSDIMKGQIPVICILPLPLAPSETCTVMDETVDQRKAEENSNIAEYSGHLGHVVAKSGNLLDSVTVNHFMKMENPITSSEGSAEITEVSAGIQNCQKHGSDGLNRSARILNQSEISGKTALGGDSSLTSSTSDVKREKNLELAFSGRPSARNTRKGDSLQVECGTAYMNYYCLAQTASSIAEELLRKSSDKINEESARSVEEIISTQLKAISKKSTKFCWPNILNLNLDAWKEKCGWCFYCKAPDDNTDCLFKMDDAGPVQEGSKSEVVGLRSKRNRKGHLIDVICHILCIEDRLRGLLLGPWLNPHHSKYWRKVVLKATDVASVKHPLLTFESNLRQLALSADWLKHVDSVVRMGSASHVVTSFVHVSSKHGISKKRGRGVDYGPTPSSNAASGLSMFWWRGGRISRHVFNWKVLPRSLARKAARQAGCTKIPGISYLESSEFAKRSKYAAWRAAVETSTSVEQLALLVRELHSNIRWDDIENTHSPSKMDKEFKKSIRPFKKVIIRRKCIEGTVVKYLLDFGKRKIIPDIVVRHGSMLEESSSGRKKYWLEESHVPLHLLKSFEEKRIARKASKMNSGKLPERSRVKKRPSKKSGFSYLFSKAEKSENYQCGHCNKDVLIRDAVSCQYCEGFFHKRHVRKSAGAITAECTYTCHKCQDGKRVRIDTERKKVQSQKGKKAITDTRPSRSKNSKKARTDRRLVRSQNNKKVSADVPLRRSARKVKHVVLQNKKLGARKKGKKIKSRKGTSRKPKKYTSWQKKRTWVYRTYWLNGLLLSKKPDDERVMHFRKKKFLPSGDLTVIHDRPKCRLCCEAEYTSTLHYVSCEICGDWFHGDAFGLNAEKIGNLIGFRCHACRKRTPPVCPHLQNMRGDVAQLGEATNNAEVEYFEEISNAVPPPSEVYVEQKSHLDQDLFPIDESIHKEEQLDMVLDPNQSILLESKLEADNGHICTGKKQETEAKNSCGGDLRPDVLTGSDQNFMLEESTIISGKGDIDAVTSLVEAEPLSCKSDVDLIDTELAPLEHSEENDGLVDTTIILKSPVDKTLVNSSELHPQTLVGSGEL
ncbi:hypothetical protein L1049_018608 [Liquidambar formosana]|uniref:Uncharacterized protein n=1 Tax=Liquidambar formosana TaxID=63359 RepID=A0AAP0RAD1_LIQFO